MTYTINYESAMMGSCYVTTEGECKDHLSDDCVFDGKEEAISVAKSFRAASAIAGDTVTVFTLDEEQEEVFRCEIPVDEESDKWIVAYRHDGSEEGETDLETETESDAREYFRNMSKSAPSWSNTTDRTYDSKTQLTYSYIEWSLSRYDADSGSYDAIDTVVTLRIYDTIDDYLANVCEEDREELAKSYYDGVEYLKRITNADNVVFGKR